MLFTNIYLEFNIFLLLNFSLYKQAELNFLLFFTELIVFLEELELILLKLQLLLFLELDLFLNEFRLLFLSLLFSKILFDKIISKFYLRIF